MSSSGAVSSSPSEWISRVSVRYVRESILTRPFDPSTVTSIAETVLMGSTNARGFIDLFRARNGYDVDAYSWFWKNRGKVGGYRLDHIFASSEFSARACAYIHEWRAAGFSDHSAIYADVALNIFHAQGRLREGAQS